MEDEYTRSPCTNLATFWYVYDDFKFKSKK